jgi:hypothetical protein
MFFNLERSFGFERLARPLHRDGAKIGKSKPAFQGFFNVFGQNWAKNAIK